MIHEPFNYDDIKLMSVELPDTLKSLRYAGRYEEELAEGEKALQILGGKVAEVRPVRLPGLDDVRAVLYIEKVKESPKKYPRKPKMAAKNPL